jgi:peptidoglycan/xylan/chitin deacetylase (PgdA/CDA1 family)
MTAQPTAGPSGAHRSTASVSLDADNLWSYLRTRGDETWSTYPSYLPVLGPRLRELWAQLGLTATVFVVGRDATMDDGAQFVYDLVAAGHEIGNHSFEHEPWLHLYSTAQLTSELIRTEDALMAAGAPRPAGFRGPGYSLSPELLGLLAARGYAYDCTTLPTWIGPLARAYYFRGSGLSAADRAQRKMLFGSAREGTRRNKGYRWDATLVEIPVTTMPVARVPIHISYLLQLYQLSPAAMRAYFRAGLRLCRLTGTQPSILMHPLDLLDAGDAPGLKFFPGMGLDAVVKREVVLWALQALQGQFEVVGTGEHARRLSATELPWADPATAGPRNAGG